MKELNNFIQEKLIIGKNTKPNSTYTFKLLNHEKEISIKLPFLFEIPDLKETVQIDKIEYTKNSYDEDVWVFQEKYSNNEYQPVVNLSEGGIYNVFIRGCQVGVRDELLAKPLIFYVNKKYVNKHLLIKLENYKDIIEVKDIRINEKLIINKNLKSNNSFQFDQNKSIKLPFNLEIPNGFNNKIIIPIHKIEYKSKEDQQHSDKYYLYGDKNQLMFIIPDYNINTLLFGNRHVIIGTILDEEIKNQINKTSTVIRYKPNKQIQESIENQNSEPTLYSNIILLNPDEDKVLILKRANYLKQWKGMWGFPGGHVDSKDKNPKEAAIRELKEETGIELSWNESYKLKEYDKIKHDNDNSICYYYITTLESNVDVKLSKEHSNYEWFNEKSEKKNHKWVPDVFQIIQKIL